jgi:hypothetical protein
VRDLGGPGILGAEPLDTQIAGRHPRGELWRGESHAAAGLSATPLPIVLLVVGLVVGPEGLNLLSRGMIRYLDPVISAALAAVGMLVGLGLDLRRPRDLRLLGMASGEAALTFVMVGVGALVVVSGQPPGGGVPWLLLPVMIGICACASSKSAAADPARLGSDASRIVELDDVLPIVLGAFALAIFRTGAGGATTMLVAQCAVLAAAVTLAAGMLLTRTSSKSEEHVYTAGLVLLLGGLAEFLGVSALFHGLVAGTLLASFGAVARERVDRDLRHLRHPVLVLLLLVAGAKVVLTAALLVAMLAYFALRSAGKLAAAVLLRRWVPAHAGWDLGRALVSPGVVAPALALGFAQAGADPSGLVLGVAVTGSIFSELLALVLRRRQGAP